MSSETSARPARLLRHESTAQAIAEGLRRRATALATAATHCGEPDPSADPDQVQATAMHPLELWTQLTKLTAALVATIDRPSDGDAAPAVT
jgi:hypothetical protein